MAKHPEANKEIETAILYYVRERIKEHHRTRRGPQDKLPKLYVHWIADVIANEMTHGQPWLNATRSMPGVDSSFANEYNDRR